jgi:hypothetical protein
MKLRVTILAILCLATAGAFFFMRSRQLSTPREMIACLPQTGAVLAYVNVDQLRSSGILSMLAGSKTAEDAEYKSFAEKTGFDYRRDLDRMAAAFVSGDSFFLIAGRFDWKKLNAYTAGQGGSCGGNSVCRVPASQPGRVVSYYPLRSNLMAIAFSSNPLAALDIVQRKAQAGGVAAADEPIWASVPAPAMRDSKLPPGARAFASPLASAENIVFSVRPRNKRLEMRLNVTCASASAASDLLIKLEGATDTLRKFIEREHLRPNPRDLSGLLVAGTFRREDKQVYGSWPINPEFIDAVASGAIN